MWRFRHHSFPSDKDSLFVALEGEGWSYLCLFQSGNNSGGGGGRGGSRKCRLALLFIHYIVMSSGCVLCFHVCLHMAVCVVFLFSLLLNFSFFLLFF